MGALKRLAYFLLMLVSLLFVAAIATGWFWIDTHGRDRYADIVWIPAVVAILLLARVIYRCFDRMKGWEFILPKINPAKPIVRR